MPLFVAVRVNCTQAIKDFLNSSQADQDVRTGKTVRNATEQEIKKDCVLFFDVILSQEAVVTKEVSAICRSILIFDITDPSIIRNVRHV